MSYREFNDMGIPVFGIHGVTEEGLCECLNPKCDALHKHPKISAWQHTPIWDEDQLDVMEMTDQFLNGYGVLCNNILVVDVDARNGGIESYEKLLSDIPEVGHSTFIVETGSGGGSKHLYFKLSEDMPKIQSHLKSYPGIDFKSSGFVVGPGSMHKSGRRYKGILGTPEDIEIAPQSLINALKTKENEKHVSQYEGSDIELTDAKIRDILDYIPNGSSLEYDEWIMVGMALHETTHGTGYELWYDWSSKSPKHDDSQMIMKWKSFGKNPNRYTAGTLIYIAKQNGYEFQYDIDDVTFEATVSYESEDEDKIEKCAFNSLMPPGLVGRVATWINSRSLYPRENLAVAAALMAVSSAGGMRYRGMNNTAGNLFCFCVAGSGTGKESILQSYTLLMQRAGIVQAVHGGIKSEQEINRNIIDHQASFYTIDEFGETLSKIQGARKKSGSASYLEGIVGALMNIYSKSTGIHLVNNDLKKTFRKELQNEISHIEKRIDDNEAHQLDEVILISLKKQFNDLETGISNPYLNILGFTAPTKFNGLLDDDLADSGFMARALIIREMDDNPRFKDGYAYKTDDTDKELEVLGNILSNMYHGGHTWSGRVELLGGTVNIPISAKNIILLDQIREVFWEMGEAQKEHQGFVAYTRRGAEMVNKLSLVLSMGESEITRESILWAFEFIKRDMQDKITLTNANTQENTGDGLMSRILSHMDNKHGVSIAQLKNKIRKYKPEVIDKAIEEMERKGMIHKEEIKPKRGQISVKFFKID